MWRTAPRRLLLEGPVLGTAVLLLLWWCWWASNVMSPGISRRTTHSRTKKNEKKHSILEGLQRCAVAAV